MRIGIGGKLGPVRVGVSTRGFGVGAGPVRVGSGWGRAGGRRTRAQSSGAGANVGCFGFAIGIACLYFVVAWPWLLGSWIAVQLGAGVDSTARSVTGWVFEGVVAALLVWLWLASSAASARQAAAQEAARAAAERAARREERAARQAALRALVERAEQYPDGRYGWLAEFDGVDLVEPRVVHPGGPKAQTRVDTGRLQVSTTAVSFLGETKLREWRWKELVQVDTDGDFFLLPVRNRLTISGVAADSRDMTALWAALQWGRAISAGVPGDTVVRDLQRKLAATDVYADVDIEDGSGQ